MFVSHAGLAEARGGGRQGHALHPYAGGLGAAYHGGHAGPGFNGPHYGGGHFHHFGHGGQSALLDFGYGYGGYGGGYNGYGDASLLVNV